MAAGDLSTDQAKFAKLVAEGTGLNPNVVVSWIGTESGWTTYKAGHNYLNIGPGRSYGSTEQAAAATVELIRGSDYYSGIVASAVQSPAAQLEAIGSSKWGTIKKTLADVYGSITEVRVVDGSTITKADFTVPNWVPGIGGETVETPGVGDVAGSLTEPLSKAAGLITAQALQGMLSLIFVSAAIFLIGFGLFTATTGKTPPEEGVARLRKVGDDVRSSFNLLASTSPGNAAAKAVTI